MIELRKTIINDDDVGESPHHDLPRKLDALPYHARTQITWDPFLR
jgi:hypothetical protein